MKVYSVKRKQFLPITIQQAWNFFSSPKNLAKITPAKMNFRILLISGNDKMYPGQIMHYKIKALPLYDVYWVTEITHVKEPSYFVDEQRFGPFKLWHHQHSFTEVQGGIEMTDEVLYSIPFGFLGRLVHALFVEREVNTIFDHRFEVLKKYFEKAV